MAKTGPKPKTDEELARSGSSHKYKRAKARQKQQEKQEKHDEFDPLEEIRARFYQKPD